MTEETQAKMPSRSEIERSAQVIATANQAGFTALAQVIGDAIAGCQAVIDAATVEGAGESPAAVTHAAKLQRDLAMWQNSLQAIQPGFVPGMESIVVPRV